ncbi:hypothetical protein [Desmospora profundinema]|uniref:Uncharacterized protein n=1 Tax=Desmospora profundinema TaxID=1571184 RepID=A0ABU1IR93_9BACL|nr:hypothetical protein [Desmospora profundinema]MDR6227308.1 hypothetical protein [Desmospora profundinema]
MGTEEREATSTKVEQVLEHSEGHFDLTRPPSREEAGMLAGRSQVTYQHSNQNPFQVRVLLPEGKQLAVTARMVGFDSLGTPDPANAPPTTLDIHYYPATLADARDHLLAAADEFGLDQRAIGEWHAQASDPGSKQAPPTVKSRWISAPVGYLSLQVQARYASPVDTPESKRIVVHYLLTWEAAEHDPS